MRVCNENLVSDLRYAINIKYIPDFEDSQCKKYMQYVVSCFLHNYMSK